MKRILMLTPFHLPNTGGAETFVDALIKEASKENMITTLTFQPFKGREPRHTWFNGVETIRMPWRIRHGQAWQGTSVRNFLSVFPQMFLHGLRLAKGKDIIHAQGLISGLAGVFLKKIYGGKLYVTLLALYDFNKMPPRFQRISRFIFKHCEIVFVEGENGKKDIEDLVDRAKIRVFQHWCDTDIFRPPINRLNDRVRVLFVGRHTKEKGRRIIEDAERILNNSKYEFIYVQDVPYKKLPAFYKMAHIVVVPSLYAEGYSRVVIESASCGCAVVVSNKGSLPEMVQPFGIVREPTPESFVNGIVVANIQSQYSYQYAKENFSPKNADVFLKEYSYGNN